MPTKQPVRIIVRKTLTDVDVTLIRLVAVLLALAGGPGIIAYIIGWIIIPEEQTFSQVYT